MKALIVDDERTAVLNLQSILETYYPQTFRVIRGVQTIDAAAEAFAQEQPDVVFLDVQLKGASGFDFLERVDHRNARIIFVTAYDQYAIKAIRLRAFDYLLKPIDFEDLGQCLRRLSGGPALVTGATPAEADVAGTPDYILFRDTYHHEKILFSHIDYLEASGPYTNIVYTKNNHTSRGTKSKSLHEFEELLPAGDFLRIHRSYIVNVHHIEKLVKQKEKHFVRMPSALLPVSRRRYSQIAGSIHHEKMG